MQRDWEIIRLILCKIESAKSEDVCLRSFDEDMAEVISYHVELLLDAGLLYGKMLKIIKGGPHDFYIDSISWAGHELLEVIRDDERWQRVQRAIQGSSGIMSINVIRTVANNDAIRQAETALTGADVV